MENKADKITVEVDQAIMMEDNIQSDKPKQKKPTLTPYQKYKNSRNQNGKKYFEFYNDVKVYTHNIWDW